MKTKKMFAKDPAKTYADGMYARVSIEGKFFWAPIEFYRNSPVPRPGATSYIYRVMVKGERTVTPLGKDLSTAFIKWQNLEADAERVRQGKAPLRQEEPETDGPARVRISDAVNAYILDSADRLKKNKLGKNSQPAYDRAVSDFRDSVKVTYMDEITRKVLLDHETWLYDNLQRRRYGKQQNTIANRFRYLNSFFKRHGIKMVQDQNPGPDEKGLLFYVEAPEEIEKKVDMYSPEEISKLIKSATLDEVDMIQFFLRTGCRDEEAAHAVWSDIIVKREGQETTWKFRVQEKPQYNWLPKNKETRDIDIPKSLYDRLMERQKRFGKPDQTGRTIRQKSDLIFPSGNGRPDMHLIRRLQAAWERAKMTGRPELHKFRRTFITDLLGAGTPQQDVMNYSGHHDLKSFKRYTAVNTERGRTGIKKVSESYGD
jgi:integrase